jgi:hypothetical protein
MLKLTLSVDSQDSALRIATGYGLDGRGFGVPIPVEIRFFSSPLRPDRFWGPAASYPMEIGDKAAGV